jgi:hypothetical protein
MRQLLVSFVVGVVCGLPHQAALAEEEVRASPHFWAVTGVAADDVLHLRDVPSADSKSLAGIPFDARGLKNFGCRRGELPFEQWVRMSEGARRAANTKWCRVEYHGQAGWVAGRFLTEDTGLAR